MLLSVDHGIYAKKTPVPSSMQGRGYGGKALERIIDYFRTKPFGNSGRIALTCCKNNFIARRLYKSRGQLQAQRAKIR